MTENQNHTDNIDIVDFNSALSERYLSYALSTIMSRSLPDVRDGLKPVHRRLLYAMRQLKLDPSSGYKKCARIVGDVIGKYHPHGDVAVYDTLVRLAQDFSLRYPLIEGQGNFGSVDGDNAAAMRYTESRMTDLALYLMQDLEKETVDFRPTYDNSDDEPVLMPAVFPNLLANGAEGIAVGMATNIPPHNLHELFDALIHLIDKPKAEVLDLMQYVQGPDFPTGGVVVDERNVIEKAYETGRGSLRVRSRWHQEDLGRGTYQVVITEIPYQVSKSKLIEKIAELVHGKKLPLIDTIADESTDEIRIVIYPKSRIVEAEMMMESLFKQTSLESRVHINLNVLSGGGAPKVMNLKEILVEFLSHRQVILQRRLKFDLDKIERRLEVLSGLMIAFLNLDEVIHIVRTEDKPKDILIAKFKLTDRQAEAILNMRLRSLSKLEEISIKREQDDLMVVKGEIEELLANEKSRWKYIKKDFKELQKKFGNKSELGARRTSFVPKAQISEICTSAFVEKEAITILCSKLGWIRALKGHNLDLSTAKYKEGDEEKFVCRAYTTDEIMLISTSGRCFTMAAHTLSTGKTHGESVRLLIDMEGDSDIASIVVVDKDLQLLFASSEGKGFILEMKNAIAKTKLGKQVMSIAKGHHCLGAWKVDGDMIATVGNNRKLLVFPLMQVPEMQRGQGVRLQKYKDAQLSDIQIFTAEDGFSFKSGKGIRVITDYIEWQANRATSGKIPPHGFPKTNCFEV